MERPAVRCQDRFVHRLRERRMREDRIEQIFSRRFELLGYHETLDQLGDFRPDKLCTKEFPTLLVPDRLREAIGVAQRDRLAIADERDLAGADLEAELARLRLRPADRSEKRRVGKGGARAGRPGGA